MSKMITPERGSGRAPRKKAQRNRYDWISMKVGDRMPMPEGLKNYSSYRDAARKSCLNKGLDHYFEFDREDGLPYIYRIPKPKD